VITRLTLRRSLCHQLNYVSPTYFASYYSHTDCCLNRQIEIYNTLIIYNKNSECQPHTVKMYASTNTALGLVMTLTSDLWPWKPFQQFPLTQWMFLALKSLH